MELVNINLKESKEKIQKIVNAFKIYYDENNEFWDNENKNTAHEMIGIIILIHKKLESLENLLENKNGFESLDLDDLIYLEIKESNIIIEYYYNVFINKKGL